MALIAHPVVGKGKSRMLCEAFMAGAPPDARGLVFYGVNQSNLDPWRWASHHATPYFYIDNSYFDCVRGQQFRVTRKAPQLLMRDIYKSDGARFAALGMTLAAPQHNPDGHIVIAEQSPFFMQHIAQEPDWVHGVLHWAKSTGRKIVRRPWLADKSAQMATIDEDLRGAFILCTHSSASAVTALAAGIPVSARPVCSVAKVLCMHENGADTRRQTFEVLADFQWTVDELKAGKAWAKIGV